MSIQNRLFRAIVVVALLGASSLHAQDSCGELLRHGIYDYFRVTQRRADFTDTSRHLCDEYQSYKLTRAAGTAVAVLGPFAIAAGLSGEQLETVGKVMCENDRSTTALNSLNDNASKVISHEGADAYIRCKELSNQHLYANIGYQEDVQGTKGVSLSLHYAPPVGDNSPVTREIRSITLVPPDSFDCDGDLWQQWKARPNASAIVVLNNSERTMVCSRRVYATPHTEGGLQVLAPTSRIVVGTSAGRVSADFAPIYAESPDWHLHVGEIVASVLTEDQFRQSYGSGWVLADARDVTGSAYARLTGRITLPDLRSRFLRGADVTGVNATGGEASHVLTISELPPHSHSVTTRMHQGGNGQNCDPAEYSPGFPNCLNNNWSWQGSASGQTGSGQSFAVLPPYVNVNYFIKIN